MFKKLLPKTQQNKAEEINTSYKAAYINFPIQLLSGFMDDTRMCIRNIYFYSIYAHFISLEKGTTKEKYKETCDWFNFLELDREENLKHGKVLFDRFKEAPMTGIERHLYTEFNKFDKSEFEKACFLAFQALKSIVGDKAFQKTDNKLLWARMDGKVKSIRNISELSLKVRYYAQEYQTLKIKKELQEKWGLIYYAQQTRGFYVSFGLDLKALILEAMKRKRVSIEKQRLFKLRLLEKEVLYEMTTSSTQAK